MSVWMIPADLPFVDTLVEGIFARVGRDPLALAGITILLPTRRAGRTLSDAFLRASHGTPLLLPRIAAVGDLDADEVELGGGQSLDIPPAIEPLRRQLLLARLIRRWGISRGAAEILPGQAVALASDLAALMDQIHAERVSLDRLEEIVPAELADHWKLTVDFLEILRVHWPALLDTEGVIDAADRRNRLIAAQVALWQEQPPAGRLLAAGFGSAIPAVADLLAAVDTLPAGDVVLTGLDAGAGGPLWMAIGQDPAHPQYGLARLLERLGVARSDVASWHAAPPSAPSKAEGRALLVREMMRPAAASDQWQKLDRLPAGAADGLVRLELPGPREEATTIALILRAQIETPGATATLVTPDRELARRVAAELTRWDIDIDDSAGTPLGRTPPGVFLRLLADAAREALAPVPLLALLKHPLAACGLDRAAFRDQVRQFEIHTLRGPRPAAGLDALRTAADAGSTPLVERLAIAIGEFLTLVGSPGTTLDEALLAHVRAAERLAATSVDAGAARLWALDAGEAAASFVEALIQAARNFGPIAGADYPVLFEAALAGSTVRPRFGRHPRLQILGTLEARLQRADLTVLAGLNEASWPGAARHDAWMSRPMRAALGLDSPEVAIGTAAHDFTLGLSAPRVVLTRALRSEGAPTVPSRWLLRLDTVLQATGLGILPADPLLPVGFAGMHALLDEPASMAPALPPAPRPPVAVRPHRLPVTAIETWMRDPYAIYARYILKLRPLDPIDQDPGVSELGSFVHEALDAVVKEHPAGLPTDALDRLAEAGRAAFGQALDRPGVWAFWWPRYLRIARWFVAIEAERAPHLRVRSAEATGRLVLPLTHGTFELLARADRIDRLTDNSLVVIDYKTGAPPSAREVEFGFAPQLPLEAVIAEAGGFAGIAAAPVSGAEFWRLSGGDPAGECKPVKHLPDAAIQARQGLIELIEEFDHADTPYLARPRVEFAPRYSDYEHLARTAEWGGGDAE